MCGNIDENGYTYICLIPVVNPQASRAITMLRFLDCVNFLAPEGRQVCRKVDTPKSKAPAGRQVNNCVRHLPRENRLTRPITLNLIPIRYLKFWTHIQLC